MTIWYHQGLKTASLQHSTVNSTKYCSRVLLSLPKQRVRFVFIFGGSIIGRVGEDQVEGEEAWEAELDESSDHGDLSEAQGDAKAHRGSSLISDLEAHEHACEESDLGGGHWADLCCPAWAAVGAS